MVIAALLTLLFRAINLPGGPDETRPEHYVADPKTAASAPVPVAAAAAVADVD